MSAKSAENRVLSCPSIKKRILFTTIITIGFLLLGEVGVRTWAHYFRTSYEQHNRRIGRLALLAHERSRVTDRKLMSILRQIAKIRQKFLPNQVMNA